MSILTPDLDRTSGQLYQGILDNPDDDGPRLVYADWLEEHADLFEPWAGWQRAEFIRIQIEKAAMVKAAPTQTTMPSRPTPRWLKLSSREAELLAANTTRWLGGAPFANPRPGDWRPVSGVRMQRTTFEAPRGNRSEVQYDGGWYDPKSRDYICVDFDRGFPGRVTYHKLTLFTETCAMLFAHHPVTSVRLDDRFPLTVEPGLVCWLGPKAPTLRGDLMSGTLARLGASKALLPRNLFRALTRSPSRPYEYKTDTANFYYAPTGLVNDPMYLTAVNAAQDDLGRACLIVGRGRAKLLRKGA